MRSNTGCDTVTGRVAAAGETVGALVAAVQAGALRAEGHDELSGLLAQVRCLQARLEFVGLAVVREVDTRGSFVGDGALSAGAWARMVTRMTAGEAASAVRTARTLGSGEWPGTEAALAQGVIDLGHVKAITAAVADAPHGAGALIEAEALAVATEADPRAVAALMARFRHALDPDAADAAALARYARRGITLAPTPDGTVHLRGLADEVTGGLLMTAIDAANPPVSGDTRTAAQSRMDALGDICRKYLACPDAPMSGGGHAHVIVTVDQTTMTTTTGATTSSTGATTSSTGATTSSTGGTPADPDLAADVTSATGATFTEAEAEAEAEADAEAEAAAEAEVNAGDGDAGDGEVGEGSSGDHDYDDERAGVLDWGAGLSSDPLADLGPIAAAAYGAGPGGTLSWVGLIAGSTARRVACDADVTYVGINDQGEATILGRETRFFTWAQRKAMIARDGDRCPVPYCDRPISWADGHHLRDWGLGGPTTIGNGALPCAAHHTMCHEGGWTLLRLPDGRYLFRHRDGKTIGPEPYPPGHNRPPPNNRPPPHNRQ